METQRKISIVSLLIAILLIVTITIGTSYSLWTTSVQQESTNTIDVGCFRIEFSDEGIVGAGNISLDKAYPISEDNGKALVPYKFNISNTCSTASSYNVILETLNTSTMDESKLDVYFNDTSVKNYASNVTEELSEDAKNGMKLFNGYLGAGDSVTYSLRVWIDYDVTVDTPNIQGKVWNGRIVVNSEATFTKPTFTNKVVGQDSVTLDIDTKNDKTVKTLECFYGNANVQNEVGTAVGTTQCQYPLTAEYAKYRVTYTDGSIDSSCLFRLNESFSMVNQLIDFKSMGAIDLEYDGVETLGANGTEDNNLRYVGISPNNYIYFNCSTNNINEMNDQTCEKWRIIGLFNNIRDSYGNKSKRVKIIRDQSLGKYSWDSSDSSVNGGYGVNQWGVSDGYDGSDLMRELNTDYIGNITVGTDSYWYNGESNKKSASMPTVFLNSDALRMIQDVQWNIGSDLKSSDSNWTSKNMYDYERSENSSKMCSSSENCTDNIMRTTTWNGKVALLYVSDYGYSTLGGETASRDVCLNSTIHSWSQDDMIDCKNNSWLYDSSDSIWTLVPHSAKLYANYVFSVDKSGYLNYSRTQNLRIVRPVVYLKNNLVIKQGDGSSNNPYKLIME